MDLKKIRQNLHEIRYFKRLICRYGESLLPGRYCLFPSMRAIVLDNESSMANAKPYFYRDKAESNTSALIAKINKLGYYYNRKSGDTKKYEAIYSANNYDKVREIKLFSFQRNEILTICTCSEDCQKQISEYTALHTFFDMPRVIKKTQYDNSYEISMIRLLPRLSDTNALQNITQCTTKYNKSHKEDIVAERVEDIISFDYRNKEICKMLTNLAANVDERMYDMEIPVCLQHGDLSRDNLIYGECDGSQGFWWIDWEHARKRIFFYDYFFYILNTAVCFLDNSSFYGYINGEFDVQLEEYFTAHGMVYDPLHKKDYFLIFAIDFLKQRVCDFGKVKALAMYFDFINKRLLSGNCKCLS